jgi:hypothetical protein
LNINTDGLVCGLVGTTIAKDNWMTNAPTAPAMPNNFFVNTGF